MKAKLFGIGIFIVLWVNAYGQIDMLTATLANQQVHDFQRERIRSEYEREKTSLAENRKSTGAPGTRTVANRTLDNFSFTVDNSIVEETEKQIIANLAKQNPVSGKNLKDALERDRPYQRYITLFKKNGLSAGNNYADVFTAYMLGMWRIANQIATNPSPMEIQAVRKQVVDNIDIGGVRNSDRQKKAAYLIYDLIFANEPYESSRRTKNQKQLQEDSDAVYRRFLQQNNMNLRNMVTTENGLVDRR